MADVAWPRGWVRLVPPPKQRPSESAPLARAVPQPARTTEVRATTRPRVSRKTQAPDPCATFDRLRRDYCRSLLDDFLGG
ncbi:hypothetical protein OIE66_29635 [Nonomuraea sp. NBC_01738]|uniref:hypothetical protein n=1 Tax=Nonomuraea sp. NBC_01738 TaxID=2976003 RepID=UPI002E127A6A|nr:hypothetical protein OIE66_29635 [Nonomuraea sp. NBC_01738]